MQCLMQSMPLQTDVESMSMQSIERLLKSNHLSDRWSVAISSASNANMYNRAMQSLQKKRARQSIQIQSIPIQSDEQAMKLRGGELSVQV